MDQSHDVRLLFATRILRLFAYGFLSVVLILYLSAVGLSDNRIGLLLTLTLAGDTIISLAITTSADRISRRGMLVTGAILVVFAGVLFASTTNFLLLLLAATIGVISPSGNEVGPFLSIEQAALSQIIPAERRTHVFAWYNLTGSFATAIGALAGGVLAQSLQSSGLSALASYRVIVLVYGCIGAVLAVMFLRLSASAEAPVLRILKKVKPASTRRAAPHMGCAWFTTLGTDRTQVVRALLNRRLRRRLYSPEYRRVLVSHPIRSATGGVGGDFLRRECSGRNFGIVGQLAGAPDRIDQHNGVHSHPFQHRLDTCSTDAESETVDCHASAALQYLANGCPDAAVLYDGCRRSGRTFRRRRRDRGCPIRRQFHCSGNRRKATQRIDVQCAILHLWRTQNCLRCFALS